MRPVMGVEVPMAIPEVTQPSAWVFRWYCSVFGDLSSVRLGIGTWDYGGKGAGDSRVVYWYVPQTHGTWWSGISVRFHQQLISFLWINYPGGLRRRMGRSSFLRICDAPCVIPRLDWRANSIVADGKGETGRRLSNPGGRIFSSAKKVSLDVVRWTLWEAILRTGIDEVYYVGCEEKGG